MSRRLAVIACVAGCGFHVNGATGTDAPLPTPDAAIDAAIDAMQMVDAAIDAPGSDGSGSGSGSGSDGSSSGSAMPPSCLARWLDGSIGSALGSVTSLGAVNTGGPERDPFLSPDELTLYYGSGGQVYVATRSAIGSAFIGGRPFAAVDDDTDTEGKMSMSIDGTTLVVTRNDGSYTNLWIASGSGGTWGTPSRMHLGAIDKEDGGAYTTINDPQLGSDGLSFMFAPSIPGGQTLKLATRADLSSDFTATDIPGFTEDTTSYSYADPWFDPYGQALIAFTRAAKGGGPTDTDLYYAVGSGGGYGSALRLTGVDTIMEEGDAWISKDYCRVYFASTRAGGAGDYDLYVATATPE